MVSVIHPAVDGDGGLRCQSSGSLTDTQVLKLLVMPCAVSEVVLPKTTLSSGKAEEAETGGCDSGTRHS